MRHLKWTLPHQTTVGPELKLDVLKMISMSIWLLFNIISFLTTETANLFLATFSHGQHYVPIMYVTLTKYWMIFYESQGATM
jgi:hypothetical protein